MTVLYPTAKPGADQSREEREHLETEDTKEFSQNDVTQYKEEDREELEDLEQEIYNLEDGPLYNTLEEDIYHIVDDAATYLQSNRPPAPMPRPESSVSLDDKPYIARGEA